MDKRNAWFGYVRPPTLLLPEKHTYRHAGKIEMKAELVFQVLLVAVLDVLGVVAKECKSRISNRQLRNILDLGQAPTVCGRTIAINRCQHLIV